MGQKLLVPSDSTVDLPVGQHRFLRKKNQTFTIDNLSRIISTYLSMYLELSYGPKIFEGVLAQLSLFYLGLSQLSYGSKIL